MKKEYLILTSAGIIAATTLGSAYLLSNKDTYIKSLGSSTLENDKLLNTISVSGNGVVYAKPDIVTFQTTISELRDTVKEAQEEANKKVSQLKEIFRKNNIDDKYIVTTNYSIYPEYDYLNNEPKLKGQRASQTIEVKIKGIDEKAEKAVKIIDEVATIDKVQIGAITFDIDDKTKLFSQARELAFKKAEQKAKELSGLSKAKLMNPVSVSDVSADYSKSSLQVNSAQVKTALDTSLNSTESNISTGQLSITVDLNVVFGIE